MDPTTQWHPVGVPGVKIGHWSEYSALTGCTVIEFPEGTIASCEVRGGAPASRELDVLDPGKTVTQVEAALLTGGSAFGLAAADGVMKYLEEQGRGVVTPAGKVPIVPALGLFDLGLGDPAVRPDRDSGYQAALNARAGEVVTGLIGAGTGACASQWRGPQERHRAGLVYAEHRVGDVVVGALCAVNAFGDVINGREPVGFASAAVFDAAFIQVPPRSHTTIGVVFTNALLDKVGCRIVAEGAHDGLARAVHPPHTRFDGDAFIAAATGVVPAPVDTVRMLATAAVTDAIRSAVRQHGR
ncbi:P1 family peptidase [Glutamicibacter sp. MNS18]|uniref:P1 family peptidase n=1 Tax=Glutamicibacter sp. MNS18 TaxID=2989817 RepID=UPI002236ABAF|nr:P1 family peptidase [Glutamicibacter sp. MNS18]MCW4465782.1 P1 family peptidase [Glutamicibacter sp. MNS18]